MTVSDDDLIAALREHGSNRKAAAALGLNARTVTVQNRRNAANGTPTNFRTPTMMVVGGFGRAAARRFVRFVSPYRGT